MTGERLHLPTEHGSTLIEPASERDVAALKRYQAAVHHFLTTGSVSALRQLTERTVRDRDGVVHLLLANPDILRQLAEAGALTFDWTFDDDGVASPPTGDGA